jgi:acyl-CoA synthetase (NDP forming)
MGLLDTDTGLAFFTFESAVATKGPLAFLSQSGGYAQEVVAKGALRGLGVSKVASYGNAADLNETDFLAYLANDAASEVIGVYIEGAKDGRGFRNALAEAARRKPVIVVKGGRTAAGGRAVASHTSSLAGSMEVWRALCRQTGAMLVGDLDEMIDLGLAFACLGVPEGRRVGILTFGGGRGVLSADECEAAGLTVPQLPPDVIRQLEGFTPGAGTSVRNPVDSTVVVALDMELFSRTIEFIAGSGVVDVLIVYLFAEFLYPETPHLLEQHIETAADVARGYRKPLAVVLSSTGAEGTDRMVRDARFVASRCGTPVYPTVGRAAGALGRFIEYHERQRQQAGPDD